MKTVSKELKSHRLTCLACNTNFEDNYQLTCKNDCNSLLRSNYSDTKIARRDISGLFKYIDWLPVHKKLSTRAAPVTYHAKNLGKEIGLNKLYVSFNGYWPEKNAQVKSCSFKEYEAYPTFQRIRENGGGIIHVASAGNTARAFSIASKEIGEKIILTVPKSNIGRVWTLNPDQSNILLFAVDGDYYDAISFGRTITSFDETIFPEGGARNIARRDGMGIVMIDAAYEMNRLPDYYFQGVGSGTGGIANYEMSLKLIKDGSFGSIVPKFFLSQNKPFTPMVNAWNKGRREIIPELDMPNAKSNVNKVFAPLLTNREPPYSVIGGVYDTLVESNGDLLAVSNSQAKSASQLFENVESIDIDPSAAVALASLISSVEEGEIKKDDVVLLNISGGGYKRIEEDYDLFNVKPSKVIRTTEISPGIEEILSQFI